MTRRDAARSAPSGTRMCPNRSGPAGRVLAVGGGEERGREDLSRIAGVGPPAELATHLCLLLPLGDFGALPHGEIGAACQEQRAANGRLAADRTPEADDLRIVGCFEAGPGGFTELQELRPVRLRQGEPAKGEVAL